MRLNEEEYAKTVELLIERGYRRSTTGVNSADHYWYKSFRRGDPDVDRGYQIILGIYDWHKYPERNEKRYSLNFEMTMNHETSMDFDRCDLMLMKDDMVVEEFERYCAGIYEAMLGILPKRKER